MSSPSRATQFFESIGCDVSKPGFHNSREFIAQEACNPGLLERYAEFVLEKKQYKQSDIIAEVAQFIFEELGQSGVLGACVDASSLLSEVLSKLGIWSFCAKGGTSIRFSDGRSPIRMAPIFPQGSRAMTGHAWVVAPPFHIVDVSLPFQPYEEDVKGKIPRAPVLSRDADIVPVEMIDLVDPLVERDVLRDGGLRAVIPSEWWEVMNKIPGRRTDLSPEAEVRYIAIDVFAMDIPLERWHNINWRGQSARTLWNKIEAILV